MLAILNYKAGNQTSVKRALAHIGIPCEVTDDPERLWAARGIIFPGVGAAGQAMDDLEQTGLDKVLKELVDAGKPLLGICVGCQILLDYSQENDTRALGIVSGECRMFNPSWEDEDGMPIRVPHMGWNSVKVLKECRLFDGIEPDAEFYFVHGYYPKPDPKYVIGTTTYGIEFCSVHGFDCVWAVQFHPEKSGRPGLKLLSNFYENCKEGGRAE